MPVTRKIKLKARKGIAMLLLITIINQVIFPTVAYALTSGPTAPEATSFEPIDTTDMVNPLSGDFTYNMPLLEIPGPEGSYPLSLAYHGGEQPNEEASWVGAGWDINPGAIARNVNGYPDDWNNVNNVSRVFWSGGTTKTFGVDVGITIAPANVNFGLSFSQDTYKGFGVGMSVGVGIGITGTPFDVGGSIGVSPFGDPYVGLNIGIGGALPGGSGLVGSASIGISTNFQQTSVGAGAGVSYSDGNKNHQSVSLLGASIGSSQGKVSGSTSLGGGSASVSNANKNHVQTESSGWSFTIPLVVFSLGASYSYVRYWTDETANVNTNGVLYNADPATATNSSYFDNNAFDTYRILNTTQTNVVDNPEPDRIVGGTFPDYDNYSVTAQGLSGYMRPYAFQNVLYTQNQKDNSDHSNDIVEDVSTPPNIITKNNLQFRFIGDFSNKYTQQINSDPSQFTFDANPVYGQNPNDGGYNSQSNQLEGSKHIEYFTNAEIMQAALNRINNTPSANDRVAKLGFVDADTYTSGFIRPVDNQIGGFMITNASGVTYHYALPAYSFNEKVHNELIDQTPGVHYNDLTKSHPYAYTWYLTAITGPDYVDVNHSGQVDANDWGYWVKFNYGKWANKYQWRNPSEGFHKDLDNQFQDYSTGQKDVYYLDAVSTRTHTAIFEKEIRADAKSGNNKAYGSDALNFRQDGSDYYPVASLRLNNIYLFNNADLPSGVSPDLHELKAASTNYVQQFGSTPVHSGNYVIDKFDLDPAFTAKCIRKIAFNYDYSLAPGIPNSYDPGGINTYVSSPNSTPLLGKLTLLSVDFQGKGGG